jgi:hypothetical protein
MDDIGSAPWHIVTSGQLNLPQILRKYKVMKTNRLFLLIALFATTASAQDTLKVMDWNLLNYVDTSRDQYYRTVLRHEKPDVLVVEEMTSQAMVDAFYSNVVNLVFPGQFASGAFINGPDTDNGIYYKTAKFTFVSNIPIHTALRDISEFKLYNVTAADTIRLYAVHLKASSGSANEVKRAAEVDSLRKVTNALPAGKYFIVMGDFNIYGSTEQAYQKLLQDNPTDDGHFVDALTMTGLWNDLAYVPYHTQSPRVRSFGGGATGGLDDRFDMILYSRAVSQPGKIQYLMNSLTPVGNDGNHYNDSINRLPNTAVPDSVANALHYASDHLPVYAKFVFSPGAGTNPTIAATAGSNGSISPGGVVTVNNGTNQQFTIAPTTGYHIDSVIVDGAKVDSTTSYTFVSVTSNHTIRVVFAINQFTITASAGINGSISPSGTVTVNYSANRKFTVTPNAGYHVDSLIVNGIKTDSTTSYTFTNVNSNHTIRSVFAINLYAITATAGSNGSILPGGTVSVVYGGSQTFSITPVTGYHVDTLLVDGIRVDSTTGYTFLNVQANHSIAARFSINTYAIVSSTAGPGTITPTPNVQVSYGGSQQFTVTPGIGAHLDSVLVDGVRVDSTSSYTFSNVQANHTISARFSFNTYTIAASAGTGGTVTPSGLVSVTHGLNQTFTFSPETNYHVDSVIVDGVFAGSGTTYTFISVVTSHTIRAVFAFSQYTITANAGEHGSVSPLGVVGVGGGANQMFDILPNPHYHVDSVVVDGAKVDSTTSYTFVNVSTNHTIRAVFAIDQYTITAAAGTHGAISPTGTTLVPFGSNQTFTVAPDSGYEIDSLFVDSLALGPAPTYQFANVTRNHSITSMFRPTYFAEVVNVNEGWNLASLPLTVSDSRKTIVFPSATSSAFAFDQTAGYVMRDILRNGEGYWLAFSSAQNVSITGTARLQDSISVHTGWNLIGSISNPVVASSIQQIPPGIVGSSYFGYTAGYSVADTLQPGKGYWVKVSQAGELVIQSGQVLSSSIVSHGQVHSHMLGLSELAKSDEVNTILVRDASGKTRKLYFCSVRSDIDLTSCELPPPPPAGIMDVRYASQRVAEAYDEKQGGMQSFPIQIAEATYPLSVSWSLGELGGKYVLEIVKPGGEQQHIEMVRGGTLKIEEPGVAFKLQIEGKPAAQLPTQFALRQNYPNPFNPATTIEFELAKAALTTLRIFNLLGQEVATIVNEQLNAGPYSVPWNARGMPSGVYFYSLQSGDAVDTRMMFLLK